MKYVEKMIGKKNVFQMVIQDKEVAEGE